VIPAVMPTYARLDIAFERGEGVYLYSEDGRRYLDFAAGIAVNVLGHCHPRLVEVLRAQAGTLWHTSNLYRIPAQERLAERLVAATFADSVFFNNSGAEAIECGLKMIRKYHDEAGAPERYRVIACRGAFHGRTLATIAAGGQEKHLAGFDPVLEGFDHVAFGNLNEARAAVTPETAAILVEPVQGEGGIHPASMDYLKGLRRMADEFGLLLFLDEIQCGMGRTGRLFAHQWSDIEPDIMAVAKGLAGGFPIGACLATEKVARALTAGSHGSTFGGNPLAMTVAAEVLDIMAEDGFLERVQANAGKLRQGLEDLGRDCPGQLVEVRGAGLMLGLQVCRDNGDFIARLMENGLLTVPAAGNVVRLLPPLIIEDGHVSDALGIIAKTCAELADG
jgi:acetylornithine/N-succinyldiaminopimelate aminotransferase